ncbi:putative MFS-type transporter YfnC [Oceanobacillus indicireducens]|uniref:MFS-type transporter YfnC n=2 Tax=Bacillaceae TaxID=186817 RepID=A0A918CZ64_9BACI|nr:putative MFS-type transporter YfnC [Oceanobacillus indicireducens]
MAKQSAVKLQTQNKTMYSILFIIGLTHLLNDSLQAVIPAMFPILERSLGLTFTQLGFITFTLNMVASVMQPVVGMYTDRRPMPYALPLGLLSSMFGMLGLAFAPNLPTILISVVLIGLGSAVFHPEGSRVAYLAAGNKRGLAQSIYQVGGNSGQALAPIITALVLVPMGQFGAIWFVLVAFIASMFLVYISRWYAGQIEVVKKATKKEKKSTETKQKQKLPKVIRNAVILLVFVVFVRSLYHSAISNYYAFYAIQNYGVSIAESQTFIFVFLLTGAIGTFIGGPLADRFGKKAVIMGSLLAPVPLTIILPYVGPLVALILIGIIGTLILSSFSVAVVYGQEMVPGKVGTMSGLIVGLAFGMGAVGSVFFGSLIDWIGLNPTMIIVSFLPLLGLLTVMLPSDEKLREINRELGHAGYVSE